MSLKMLFNNEVRYMFYKCNNIEKQIKYKSKKLFIFLLYIRFSTFVTENENLVFDIRMC